MDNGLTLFYYYFSCTEVAFAFEFGFGESDVWYLTSRVNHVIEVSIKC